MVEELKLAIKIDDASIEQSLLKQFANAQKMADKVVLNFKNVNFNDKTIEAKFKEMQKKAGRNPINLSVSDNTLDMLNQIDKSLTDILNIGKGKSIIDSSSITSEVNKATDSIKNGFTNSINSVKSEFENLKSEIAEVENAYNKIKRNKYTEQQSRYVDNHSNNYVDLSKYDSTSKTKANFEYLEGKLKEIYTLYNNIHSSIENNNGWFNGQQYNSSDLNQLIIDFKSLAQAYYELDPTQVNKSMQELANGLGTPIEKVKTLKQVTARMSDEFKGFVSDVITDSNNVKANNNAFNKETQNLIKENEKAIETYLSLKEKLLSKISNKDARYKISDYLPYIDKDFPDFSNMNNFGTNLLGESIDVLKEMCNILGIEIPNSVEKANTSLNNNTAVSSQEKLQDELKKTESQAEKTAQAVKEASSTSSQDRMKDAFPKTSENLEQVAQSEQKVQQEAVATDKALDNISFTPNTEGFDDIIAKFGILREQAEQITKIVKTTKQTADGTSISYKATLRNGSSYYLGENSTPQVLNASETVYDTNAIEKAYQEATKVNNALNETNSLLNSLKIPNGFEGSFSTLESEVKRLNSEFTSGRISATEYANSIKKAFGNYQTPIDNKSKDIWNDLTSSLDRYATLQKRIASNNALSTDNEEAAKLLEYIHELQRSDVLPSEKLNESNKKLQQINQTVTDLKAKLKESTLDSLQGSIDKYQRAYNNYSVRPSNEQSGAYKNALINLNSAIQELEKYKATLLGMSEVTEKQEAHIEELVSKCVKATDAFKQMSASQKGAKEIGIAKSIQRINKDLAENTRYSKTAKQNLQALLNQLESGDPSINLEKINSEIIKIENSEIRAGRAGKSFLDIFKTKAVHGFLGQAQSYLSMYIGFYGMVNKVRSAVSTIIELDDALIDLKKTTAMNSSQLEQFYLDANDVAKQMGVTTQEIIEQASAWSRLGFSSAEASTQMSKLSAQFAAISPGMDIDTATDGLVSTMKAFDIDVQDAQREVMDNINKIGNTAATSNDEIVDMLTRSSAAMSAANNTLEETIALETAAVEITRSAETTGTAFKTLSMRLRGYDEETESYTGDVEELSGAIADLTKTAKTPGGISLFTDDTKQTYKSTYQLLKEISDIYSDLSDKNRAELLEKLAGKRGGQVVAGLLSNFSAAEKAMKNMDEAAGSSDDEMSIIEQSLTYKINALKETWVGTVQDMVDRGDLGTIVDGLTKVSEIIGTVTGKLGILKTVALSIAAVASVKNFGKCVRAYMFQSNCFEYALFT